MKKSFVTCQMSNVKCGFTLIELMIVIGIFGLTASLITASYLNFDKNQRVKNAGKSINGDIRLVQNNAFSGNKGLSADSAGFCDTTQKQSLYGWYIGFSTDNAPMLPSTTPNQLQYTISVDCLNDPNGDSSGLEILSAPPIAKVVPLPSGVTVTKISCGGSNFNQAYILYRPLSNTATYYSHGPQFKNALDNVCTGTDQFTVKLTGPNSISQDLSAPAGAAPIPQ